MNPYETLPEQSFWSPAVGKRNPLDIDQLWTPRWQITPDMKIATFGSCFAQHIGKALQARGYNWVNFEPGPLSLSAEDRSRFNYDVFSARTGNIYTTTMLKQWVDWALEALPLPKEVWQVGDRFYDPFRPAIEPNGFASRAEVIDSRNLAIRAFGDAIRGCDVFVFTLGLTESWRNKNRDVEYAMCPGTVAGEFDPDKHVFANLDYRATATALRQAFTAMHGANGRIKVLLTVSPVPLTATASARHVLVATTYSKSVLRAVAGDFVETRNNTDYFPSYEIITAPPFGGQFFADNKSVRPEGVDHVMTQFFADQQRQFGDPPPSTRVRAKAAEAEAEDLVCEEVLLNAFAPQA